MDGLAEVPGGAATLSSRYAKASILLAKSFTVSI